VCIILVCVVYYSRVGFLSDGDATVVLCLMWKELKECTGIFRRYCGHYAVRLLINQMWKVVGAHCGVHRELKNEMRHKRV